MDEEFIFQVTEEELAQFPEIGNQSEEEQNQQERGGRAVNGFLSGDSMWLPRGSCKGSDGCYDL